MRSSAAGSRYLQRVEVHRPPFRHPLRPLPALPAAGHRPAVSRGCRLRRPLCRSGRRRLSRWGRGCIVSCCRAGAAAAAPTLVRRQASRCTLGAVRRRGAAGCRGAGCRRTSLVVRGLQPLQVGGMQQVDATDLSRANGGVSAASLGWQRIYASFRQTVISASECCACTFSLSYVTC